MHDIDDYPQTKTIPGLVRAELSHRGVIVGLARVKQDLLKDLRGVTMVPGRAVRAEGSWLSGGCDGFR